MSTTTKLDHLGKPLAPFRWNPSHSRSRNLHRKYNVREQRGWEGEFYRHSAYATIPGETEQNIVCEALSEDFDKEIEAWIEAQEAKLIPWKAQRTDKPEAVALRAPNYADALSLAHAIYGEDAKLVVFRDEERRNRKINVAHRKRLRYS